MSETQNTLSAAAQYAAILKNNRKSKLPPGYPEPQPPDTWPAENVALLERYLTWLLADNAGPTSIHSYYLPVAGHILGYNLKPHQQLDLENDLEQVLDYLRAKQVSDGWLTMGRHALNRFRRFMHEEQGVATLPPALRPVNLTPYYDGLPEWLVGQIRHFQHIRQANWRQSQLHLAIIRFWSSHTRLWRWLFARYAIESVGNIKRAHLFTYIDERIASGYNPKSVNQDLRCFQATLRFLEKRDFEVPQTLLRLPGLKEPDSLPRFLTDEPLCDYNE